MAEIVENTAEEKKGLNFVQQIIADDLAAGKNGGRLSTRFPPEPNGYLHIGHAKAICMDFGAAEMFGGTCNLRFDDTNPIKEDTEYVDAIKEDIKWLGFDWEDREYYASDYFPQLFDLAIQLIKEGKGFFRAVKVTGDNDVFSHVFISTSAVFAAVYFCFCKELFAFYVFLTPDR